jgi:hypothetical protein
MLSFIVFTGGILLQSYGIFLCLRIMKARYITTKSRWIWSLVIFMCPLVGIFLYQTFRDYVGIKEYKFFSQRFIDHHLS